MNKSPGPQSGRIPRMKSAIFCCAALSFSASPLAQVVGVGDGAIQLATFVREARSKAGDFACDWAAISQLLNVEIVNPDGLRGSVKEQSFSDRGEIRPRTGSPISGGWASRFRSTKASICSVVLKLQADRWCKTTSESLEQQLDMGPWNPWQPPHGPDGKQTVYQLFSTKGHQRKGEIWISSSTGSSCFSRVSIHVPAVWLAPELERAIPIEESP